MKIHNRSVSVETWSFFNAWSSGVGTIFHRIKNELKIHSLEVSHFDDDKIDFQEFAAQWGVKRSSGKTARDDSSPKIVGFHAPSLLFDNNFFDQQVAEIADLADALGTSNVTIMDDNLMEQKYGSVTCYIKLLVKTAKALRERKTPINVFFHLFEPHLLPIGAPADAQNPETRQGSNPSALELLLTHDKKRVVGIQLDTHWLACGGYTSPNQFLDFMVSLGVETRDTFLKRQLSIHLSDMLANGDECALGKGVVSCDQWLDFVRDTPSVQNVILEFRHEVQDKAAYVDVFQLLADSLDWMNNIYSQTQGEKTEFAK